MPFQFPDNIPSVAKSWEPDEQRKCIAAANKVLDGGGDDKQAIFACIGAAGKSEDSAQVTTAQVTNGQPARKVSKDEANYRKATGPRRCAGCRFFVKPASCQVVAGDIAANFTSDKYKPLQEQAAEQFLIPFSKALRDDILIFPVGKFHRDGQEREFTTEMGAQMVANFRANILERKNDGWLPINAEHMREHGRLGDIVALYQDERGNVRGKPHAPDGRLDGFDYFSPEVRWKWTHPTTGKEHSNVLMGGGATNYPFFLGKMALQGEVVPVLKSANLPLIWSGSEWEAFNMDKPLDGIMGRMLKTAIEALGRIQAMARGGSEEKPREDFEPEHSNVPSGGFEVASGNETFLPSGANPAKFTVDDSQPLFFSDPSQDTSLDFVHTVQFAASDEAKRIMTGIVLLPDVADIQGHVVSAEDIENAAHDFMSRLRLDAHHERLVQSSEAQVVESWIAKESARWELTLPSGDVRVTDVPVGAWCMSVRIASDELWSEVLSGEIGFFSPVGTATATPIT